MRLMLDLNLLLDVVQRREPFYEASASVLSKTVAGEAVASAAEASGCDVIVTRNVSDFAGSPVHAMTPEELLAYVG